MPEIYSDEIWRAVQALFLSTIAAVAFRTAKKAALDHGRWWSIWRSIGYCFLLGLFAAATMGSPSCEEAGDPLYGGCETYAEDGYDPGLESRYARLLFVFLVTAVPAFAGAVDVSKWEIHKRKLEREKALGD